MQPREEGAQPDEAPERADQDLPLLADRQVEHDRLRSAGLEGRHDRHRGQVKQRDRAAAPQRDLPGPVAPPLIRADERGQSAGDKRHTRPGEALDAEDQRLRWCLDDQRMKHGRGQVAARCAKRQPVAGPPRKRGQHDRLDCQREHEHGAVEHQDGAMYATTTRPSESSTSRHSA